MQLCNSLLQMHANMITSVKIVFTAGGRVLGVIMDMSLMMIELEDKHIYEDL